MKDKHKEHTKQLEKQLIELKDKHSTIKRKKEIELTTAMRDWEAAASLVQPCQQAVASADHLSREDKEARIQKLAELLLFSKDRLDAVFRPRRTKQKSVQKKSLQGKRSQSREVQKKKKLNKPLAQGTLGNPSDQPLKFPQDSVQGRPSDGDLEGAEEMHGGEEATNEEQQEEEYAAEGEEEQYYDGMEENLPEAEHFGANRPGARPQSAAGGRR